MSLAGRTAHAAWRVLYFAIGAMGVACALCIALAGLVFGTLASCFRAGYDRGSRRIDWWD